MFRPSAIRRSVVLLGLTAALALGLAACGDDESTSTAITEGAGTTGAEPSPPAGGDATSTDLEPGDGGAGVPNLPDNEDVSAVQCTGAPKDVFDATEIIGEPVDEATRQARDAGCDLRVVVEDGRPLAATSDFRPDRIDVVVSDGEVEKIDGLY
jgi:hypothetical protein